MFPFSNVDGTSFMLVRFAPESFVAHGLCPISNGHVGRGLVRSLLSPGLIYSARFEYLLLT